MVWLKQSLGWVCSTSPPQGSDDLIYIEMEEDKKSAWPADASPSGWPNRGSWRKLDGRSRKPVVVQSSAWAGGWPVE
jgi:hypothetical protein